MIPRLRPMATAWVRSFAPNFSMMCLMCTFTVSSVMKSFSAISRFRFPPAISRNTSISRSVSASSLKCSASCRPILRGNLFSSGVHLSDGRQQLLRRHALQQVSASSCLQCPLDFHIAFKRRQHDDPSLWKFTANCDHRVNPALSRQSDVHQRDIWLSLPELL